MEGGDMPAFSVKPMLCSLIALACLAAAPASKPGDSPASRPADEVVKLRADLLELLGNADVTPADVSGVLLILEEKRQLIIVQLAGKRARLRALQDQTDEILSLAEKAIQNDEAITAALKAIASQQQQLTVAQKSGASPTELSARLTDISRESMLISERQELIRTRFRGGILGELSRCLVETSADVKDLEAQLTFAESQITRIHQTQAASVAR
jgi:hypothetical protein